MRLDLSPVGIRLDKTALSQGLPEDPIDAYSLYEMLAISELDSTFDKYYEDELYLYLRDYLKHKRSELGLSPLT